MTRIVLAFNRWHPLPFGARTHVALVHGDDVIEASAFGRPKGVRTGSLYPYINDHPGVELRSIRHPNPEGVWDACCSQLGKPYDYGWYFAMLTRDRDWQHDDAWVCHELIAWACEAAGHAIVDWTLPRLKPMDLYQLTQGD